MDRCDDDDGDDNDDDFFHIENATYEIMHIKKRTKRYLELCTG